jgi:hypothetical protein
VLYLDHAGVFRRIQPAAQTIRRESRGSARIVPTHPRRSMTPITTQNNIMFENQEKPPIVYQFNENATATVAYVVAITGSNAHEGQVNQFMSVDGAAVLAHSIRPNSIHGLKGGSYDYHLHAFYHPNVSSCARLLEKLGYIVRTGARHARGAGGNSPSEISRTYSEMRLFRREGTYQVRGLYADAISHCRIAGFGYVSTQATRWSL